jgi:hypothetical protein
MTFFTAKLHCNSIIYLLFRANIESTITYHATTTQIKLEHLGALRLERDINNGII